MTVKEEVERRLVMNIKNNMPRITAENATVKTITTYRVRAFFDFQRPEQVGGKCM
jgi:hypothetical protein